MAGVKGLAPAIGAAAACSAKGIKRATFYRKQRPLELKPAQARPKPPRAPTEAERARVLEVLHEERFIDQSPVEVYVKIPARRPDELWCWAVTKVLGPQKWMYLYLYVLVDVYSRCVVGWLLAERESATLAERLLEDAYAKQGIRPGQLTVHADRGAPMVSKPPAHFLTDLCVTKTHNRPHVSSDDPYSAAQFTTPEYPPTFPKRFGCHEDPLAFCRRFFQWYNEDHYHTGLGLLTPASVHYGTAEEVLRVRHQALLVAYDKHPERFLHGPPRRQSFPSAIWINPPAPAKEVTRM